MKKIETEQYTSINKKASTWSNAPGSIISEIMIDPESPESGWHKAKDEEPLPSKISNIIFSDIISKMIPIESAELEITFTSKGSDTPSSMYGGADNLGFEAQYEDERTIDSVNVYINGQQVGSLPQGALHVIEDIYSKEISNADVEHSSPDDYDPREDYDDVYDPRGIE